MAAILMCRCDTVNKTQHSDVYFYLLVDFADFLIGTENKLHCTTA